MLEVNKNRCIVLEDSNYGMRAAINAGMKVIVIPEKGTNPKWSKKANLKLNSLEKFTINHLIDL
ncbi:MAG: HAD family hydrolase, partial [Flavobacteriales bacterium]|nr:HAD family hydrolase [Flavobacteriales bacterium]